MEDLIILIAKGEIITDDVIKESLTNICWNVHSSCNDECPVYKLNGNKVPDTANNFNVNRGCDCFKDGNEMLKFIRTH
jgi:hypothetical protein